MSVYTLPTPTSTVARLCISYLKRYLGGKMKYEDFERETAYAFLLEDSFKEIHPADLPTTPPELAWLENATQKQKENIDWNNPVIKEYLDKKRKAQNLNNTRLAWLKEVQAIIPQGDTLAHTKLTERINEFNGRLHHFGPRTEAA